MHYPLRCRTSIKKIFPGNEILRLFQSFRPYRQVVLLVLLTGLYFIPERAAASTILSDSITIRGTVRDARSKSKISGVGLLINGKGIKTSDANGNFSITLPVDRIDGSSVITVRMLGYEEKKIRIDRKYRRQKMKIYLSAMKNKLKEDAIITCGCPQAGS